MSFPRYEEYKDSGISWLGELPSHWEAKKVGHLADLITGFAFPSDGFSFDDSDSTIPLVRGENVSAGFLRWDDRGRYWPVDSPYEERYLLDADDIVVQMDGSRVGKNWALVSKDDLPLLLVQRVTRIRCQGVNPKFAFSLIANEMFSRYVDIAKTDPAVPHITMRNIADYWIPLPPPNEQIAIANFLDRETSKIDGLVEEQRRLIALLREKRQAVISHAVTKGLDPTAPMKPSGIDWLGDVPEHWEVKKLRYFAEVLRGKFTHRPRNDPAFYDGEYPFVQTGEITSASKYITSYRQTLNERGISVSKQFPKGTLVMAIAANIGDVAILDFPAYFPDSIVGLVPNQSSNVMFMYYLMQAMKQPMLQTATISTQMNLNVEQICSLAAACPPVDEQDRIAQFLDSQLMKMDKLIAEAKRAIELLQEHRTALISAAVTGKIDVRQFT